VRMTEEGLGKIARAVRTALCSEGLGRVIKLAIAMRVKFF
jgi:hypothetical protein